MGAPTFFLSFCSSVLWCSARCCAREALALLNLLVARNLRESSTAEDDDELCTVEDVVVLPVVEVVMDVDVPHACRTGSGCLTVGRGKGGEKQEQRRMRDEMRQ